MSKSLLRFLAASAVCLVARVGMAAPINFDESIGGDLDTLSIQVFTLDLGVNTVRGLVTGSFISGDPLVDSDYFAMRIPVGLRATDVVVDIEPTFGEISEVHFYLSERAPVPPLYYGGIPQGINQRPISKYAFPIGAGFYDISVSGAVYSPPFFPDNPSHATAAWTWRLTVIPEPASGLLGLVALAGGSVRSSRLRRCSWTCDSGWLGS